MLVPVFAAVGVVGVPLLAATTALCLSIEAVRISLSNKEHDQIASPVNGSAVGGNSNGTSPSSGY